MINYAFTFINCAHGSVIYPQICRNCVHRCANCAGCLINCVVLLSVCPQLVYCMVGFPCPSDVLLMNQRLNISSVHPTDIKVNLIFLHIIFLNICYQLGLENKNIFHISNLRCRVTLTTALTLNFKKLYLYLRVEWLLQISCYRLTAV